MGFYSPAVLVKDAQRHGLRVRPINVQRSEWPCTLEAETGGSVSLRMGMNYAKGLRQTSAEALVAARSEGEFASVDDLTRRVPTLNRKELVALARIGALNALGEVEHRRDALWQVEWAGRPVGPLLRGSENDRVLPPVSQTARKGWGTESSAAMPLKKMTSEERLAADYAGTGLTTGPHPMAYHRAALRAEGISSAAELMEQRSGRQVAIAGCVIARQRPGTAKGFVFLSVEDETGIANVILTPDVFERDRLVVTRSRFLRIEGPVQNQEGVVHVKAQRLEPLEIPKVEMRSRDFR
jgi:error-prone DNA polymerase